MKHLSIDCLPWVAGEAPRYVWLCVCVCDIILYLSSYFWPGWATAAAGLLSPPPVVWLCMYVEAKQATLSAFLLVPSCPSRALAEDLRPAVPYGRPIAI